MTRPCNVPVSITISANGMIPGQWASQSSPDLKTWTTIAEGANLAVKVALPVSDLTMQFFRLTSQSSGSHRPDRSALLFKITLLMQ